jgi:crossover junction endodeoxyribonuclease RuvC
MLLDALREFVALARVPGKASNPRLKELVVDISAEAGIPLGEYSALEVKTGVVGYGRAEKRQVQLMTCSLLKLEAPIASEDAADALAVAICHANRSALKRRLEISR